MYIVVSYDVKAIRCDKINKILRRYLFQIHNSVFEGSITEKQYKDLQVKILNVIEPNEDKIIFYRLQSDKYLRKDYIGTHLKEQIFY